MAEPTLSPAPLPDIATAPHPVAGPADAVPPGGPYDTGAGLGRLTDALPAVHEAARKVGGFKRLAEIAGQLDRGEDAR